MSWDVMLFNFEGGPPVPVASMTKGFSPLALVSPDRVRQLISTQLPDVDWTDPTWGLLKGQDFSIEFNVGGQEVLHGLMLHVRGGGDPIAPILRLCTAAGWSALDISTSSYLDPVHPPLDGWQGFQRYRDQVVGPPTAPSPCPTCNRPFSRTTGNVFIVDRPSFRRTSTDPVRESEGASPRVDFGALVLRTFTSGLLLVILIVARSYVLRKDLTPKMILLHGGITFVAAVLAIGWQGVRKTSWSWVRTFFSLMVLFMLLAAVGIVSFSFLIYLNTGHWGRT